MTCPGGGVDCAQSLVFHSANTNYAAMENCERTAIDMIRRYGSSEAAIQQAHAYDVEAITDEDRAFWRAVLVELRSYGVRRAAE